VELGSELGSALSFWEELVEEEREEAEDVGDSANASLVNTPDIIFANKSVGGLLGFRIVFKLCVGDCAYDFP